MAQVTTLNARPVEASATPVGGTRGWSVWLLAVAFVIYVFSFQTGYSVFNRSIQHDVGLTVARVGLIAATYTWSFALFQLFSGALLDRLGARKILVPAIALVTTGVFAFSRAGSFESIIGAQLILALGACAGFVGAGYVGGRWFGMAKFSFMFGLVQCFASTFSAFNQNLFGFALKHLAWRELFSCIGFAGLALCILAILFIRDPAPVAGPGLREGIGRFVRDVLSGMLDVAKVGHVWIAAVYGALVFGTLLAAGVVWAPRLMLVRGLPPDIANVAASVLWLGMAAGCLLIPWWSDVIKRRKRPVVVGIVLQLAALLALVYLPQLSAATSIVLWFLFGVGAAAHMLAFSTAGDVVRPDQIGTSAAIVNGTMFVCSGFLIDLPGSIANRALAGGGQATVAIAAMAARPLILALVIAILLAALTRESFPKPSGAL